MEDRRIIRDEVVRLKGALVRGSCAAQVAMETACKEEAYDEVLDFIDSMDGDLKPEPVERYCFLLHYAELANGKSLTSDRSMINTDIRMMVAKRMREEGYTCRDIGEAAGRDHSTVSYWVNSINDILSVPVANAGFMRRWRRFLELVGQ